MTHLITVCIGSNVPECHNEIRTAIEWLKNELAGIRHTPAYPTEPEGINAGHTPYLNAVLTGTTLLSKDEIEVAFKNYERKRGRTPAHKAEGRIIIDIDLVCYDDDVVRPEEFHTAYFRTGYLNLKQEQQ